MFMLTEAFRSPSIMLVRTVILVSTLHYLHARVARHKYDRDNDEGRITRLCVLYYKQYTFLLLQLPIELRPTSPLIPLISFDACDSEETSFGSLHRA